MKISKLLGGYIKDRLGITELSFKLKTLEQRLENEVDFSNYLLLLLGKEVFHTTHKPNYTEIAPTEIHANDMMFLYQLRKNQPQFDKGIEDYFRIGKEGAENLSDLVDYHHLNSSSILDFGSGYGRMSRFLPHYFSSSQIYVSEVKKKAMKFQSEYFGYESIHHNRRVESFPDDKYDIISALSVFTHLNEADFRAWFKKLLSCLNPNGALIFTYNEITNSNGSFEFNTQSEDQAMLFVPDALSDTESYGSTKVSEGFIQSCLASDNFEVVFPDNSLSANQKTALVKRVY